jgi:hypothetical protein
MMCDELNQELTLVNMAPGKYRLDAQSLKVVDCPQLGACVGRDTASTGLCAVGHSGLLCQVCVEVEGVTHVWSGDRCAPCDGGKEVEVYSAVVVLALLLFGIIAFVTRRIKQESSS